MENFEHIVELVQKHPKLVAVDDYELCIRKTTENEKEFINGLESSQTKKDQLSIGIRLIHRKQPGKSIVTQVSKESIQWMVDTAYASADRSPVDPWFRFPMWKVHGVDGIKSENVLLDNGFSESVYPHLSKRPHFLKEKFGKREEEFLLVRKTERARLSDKRSTYFLETAITFDNEGEWVDEREFGTDPLRQKKDSYIDSLGIGFSLTGATPYREKVTGPTILGPRVMSYLLSLMQEWFYADFIQRGESPFALVTAGTPIFSKAITLIDDGTVENRQFDAEGTPTQKTVLVEGGIVKDFLYDTYAATRENRLSTGNLVLRPDGLTQVGSHHFFIKPSSDTDLVKVLGNGITIDGIDAIRAKRDNRLLLIGRGWRVEGGKLCQPLCEIPLEINLLELLPNALQVGEDLQFFRKTGSPSILFENIPKSR